MTQTITLERLEIMLRKAAQKIRDNKDDLSHLDTCGGDGDHGVTMSRAMDQMEGAMEKSSPNGIKSLLHDIGWAIMGVDGGATGPLFGSLFMAMAEAAGKAKELDAPLTGVVFEAGLEGVRKRTRAQVGDKTLIDALVPAVEALAETVRAGGDLTTALEAAADAAEGGALSTKTLKARFGRAKNVGEKSIGMQDPGATSVALLFKGFSEGVVQSG